MKNKGMGLYVRISRLRFARSYTSRILLVAFPITRVSLLAGALNLLLDIFASLGGPTRLSGKVKRYTVGFGA